MRELVESGEWQKRPLGGGFQALLPAWLFEEMMMGWLGMMTSWLYRFLDGNSIFVKGIRS